MGVLSYLAGHGWDGTKETPAERHMRTMEAEVAAWKARYAEASRTSPHLYDTLKPGEQRFIDRWQENIGGEESKNALVERYLVMKAERQGKAPLTTMRHQIRQHPGEVERGISRKQDGGMEW